jgi:hypothetical protein
VPSYGARGFTRAWGYWRGKASSEHEAARKQGDLYLRRILIVGPIAIPLKALAGFCAHPRPCLF